MVPRIGDSTRRAMTADEARSLLEASADHRLGTLFTLLLETGLRRGEALGLRWDDVDLDGRSLNVCHTMIRVAGKLTATRARRLASLAAWCTFRASSRPLCGVHRRRQLEERLSAGPGWHESGHVFASSIGYATRSEQRPQRVRSVMPACGARSLDDPRAAPHRGFLDVVGRRSLARRVGRPRPLEYLDH